MGPDAWEAFAPALYTSCEPPVAGWIAHPAGAISALAYLLAAAIAWRRDAMLTPGLVAIVGAAAFLFHASGTDVGQRIDLMAVVLLNTSLLRTAGLALWPGARRLAVPVAGAAAVAPILHPAPGFAAAALGAVALLLIWHRLAQEQPQLRQDVRTVTWIILPAAALLALGHLGIGCVTGAATHVVQPHVVWHLASATACVIACRIDRGVQAVPTRRSPTM